MNEMELLRQMAQETPLPAPGELDAARARLVAAITTDPATHAIAVAPVTTAQPGASTGQAVDLLRPAAPATVRDAVKFMYGGAAGSAAGVIAVLPFIGGTLGHWNGHRITATPLSITLFIVGFGLVFVAPWLWMARAVGRGRNWARICSTVLFALATLALLLAIGSIGKQGVAQAVFAGLTWLSGLAAVWLLWRPASRAFFQRYPLRADHAGITLNRQRYPLTSRPATFVPWADVQQIILYTSHHRGGPAPWIGIRRRDGAPALPSGNEQAPFCPVPGVAAGATRWNKGSRLGRERLAAVTAAVAPGISVVEASAGPAPQGPG
jgi:hypothetical protein